MKLVFFILLVCIKSVKLGEDSEVNNLFHNNLDFELLKDTIANNESHINFGTPGSEYQDLDINNVNYTDLILEAAGSSFSNITDTSPRLTSSWIVKNLYLFTRNYRKGKEYESINPKNLTSILSSHFSSRPTYIIVHGFISNGLEPWILSIKDKLLKREDCNVVSVDWPAGSSWFVLTYLTAAGKVSTVGNNTAELLSTFIKHKGLVLEQVHCIGHSLGAHVCGFCGKKFPQKMARISGLDPAGPMFHHVNSTKRLDKKDATYVDVMHTNGCNRFKFWTDCYGIDENIGHSDFYPNGGMHQPYCSLKVESSIGCSHEMAYKYFNESLDYNYKKTTYFYARPCTHWFDFFVGLCPCGRTYQYMGMDANSAFEGSFFLETHPVWPFAMEDPSCSKNVQWNLFILIGRILAIVICVAFLTLMVVLLAQNVRQCLCANTQSVPLVPEDQTPILTQ